MTIQELQNWVAADWKQYPENIASPDQQVLLILEELGEVSEVLRKQNGRKTTKEFQPDLGGELADVLISLVTLANTHKVDLTLETQKFQEKILARRSLT